MVEVRDIVLMKAINIIGCGITGCTIARKLADKGYFVTIYDRRNHIGGNLFDYEDSYGIRIHEYGPHIFHTNNEEVFDFITRFGKWEDFSLVCGAVIKSECVSTAFDYTTIDTFYERTKADQLKEALENNFPKRSTVTVLELLDSENELIREYGKFLYKNDYEPYTSKQWGISPEKIDKQIFKRVPVRIGYKQAYFDDKYQVMPKYGYTEFVKNVLNHPNIKVVLNSKITGGVSFDGNKMILPNELQNSDNLIFTGAIDELFGHKFGYLPYRSLRFEIKHENTDSYQKYPVVAYPMAEGYTRITEYKKLPIQKAKGSTYAVEYPVHVGESRDIEPYYPILTEESVKMYEKYREFAKNIKGLYCIGRLADFKYYNMDQAIERALEASRLWE